jgi:protein gp37
MENSKIGWCHHTVNLWWGCYEVHKGCDNCYAKKLANIYHGPDLLWEQNGPRMAIKTPFNDIAKYQKRAAALGERHYVFMNSMSDIFEKSMPLVDAKHQPILIDGQPKETQHLREQFFKLVDDCPNLIFLLLTKRPGNILDRIPPHWVLSPR